MSALIVGQGRCEVWTFELPSITLRRRQPIERDKDGRPVEGMGAVVPHGLVVGWQTEPPAGQDDEDPAIRTIATDTNGGWKASPLTAPEAPKNIAVSNGWIALPVNELQVADAPSRHVIHLLDSANCAVRDADHGQRRGAGPRPHPGRPPDRFRRRRTPDRYLSVKWGHPPRAPPDVRAAGVASLMSRQDRYG
jgi:hypothetical protein